MAALKQEIQKDWKTTGNHRKRSPVQARPFWKKGKREDCHYKWRMSEGNLLDMTWSDWSRWLTLTPKIEKRLSIWSADFRLNASATFGITGLKKRQLFKIRVHHIVIWCLYSLFSYFQNMVCNCISILQFNGTKTIPWVVSYKLKAHHICHRIAN